MLAVAMNITGEIEGNIQIIIHEMAVCSGSQEPPGGRRPGHRENLADLVDFIEHENRVIDAQTPDFGNNPARHRPDIGAAMAPQFNFIRRPARESRTNFRPRASARWPCRWRSCRCREGRPKSTGRAPGPSGSAAFG